MIGVKERITMLLTAERHNHIKGEEALAFVWSISSAAGATCPLITPDETVEAERNALDRPGKLN